jgi:hypothetical protein
LELRHEKLNADEWIGAILASKRRGIALQWSWYWSIIDETAHRALAPLAIGMPEFWGTLPCHNAFPTQAPFIAGEWRPLE